MYFGKLFDDLLPNFATAASKPVTADSAQYSLQA
jgi:hypothetical protein